MDVAITGGYVVPIVGEPIDGGTVLIQDGRIAAVGTAAEGKTPSTRLGVAAVIREAFAAAQDYRRNRQHKLDKGEPHDRDLTKETLVRVLDGELLWDQHTHRADDILTAVRLAEEFGYQLVV